MSREPITGPVFTERYARASSTKVWHSMLGARSLCGRVIAADKTSTWPNTPGKKCAACARRRDRRRA